MRKLSIQSATSRLASRGIKLLPKGFDLSTMRAIYAVYYAGGHSEVMDAAGVKKLLKQFA